jgi:hypothetical protein
LDYLRVLNKASKLRDVAIEKKEIYEPQAQAFIDGKKTALPASTWLRQHNATGVIFFAGRATSADRCFRSAHCLAKQIRHTLIAVTLFLRA